MKLSISIAFVALATLTEAAVLPCSLVVATFGPASVSSSSFPVTATITNPCTSPFVLLNDPSSILLPDVHTNKFDIVPSPPFIGPAVKWSPDLALEAKAWTIVKAGETLSFKYDLVDAYDFTKSRPGKYGVLAHADFYSVIDKTTYEFISVKSVGHVATLA